VAWLSLGVVQVESREFKSNARTARLSAGWLKNLIVAVISFSTPTSQPAVTVTLGAYHRWGTTVLE
jgi:uncharacterized membrane protein (Fun14 family)